MYYLLVLNVTIQPLLVMLEHIVCPPPFLTHLVTSGSRIRNKKIIKYCPYYTVWTINDVTEKNPGDAKPGKGRLWLPTTTIENGGGFLVLNNIIGYGLSNLQKATLSQGGFLSTCSLILLTVHTVCSFKYLLVVISNIELTVTRYLIQSAQ